MTMLDKCARAIGESYGADWDTLLKGDQITCRKYARAVLEALRDPTPEMIAAGHSNMITFDARAIFTAMIDEALKERT